MSERIRETVDLQPRETSEGGYHYTNYYNGSSLHGGTFTTSMEDDPEYRKVIVDYTNENSQCNWPHKKCFKPVLSTVTSVKPAPLVPFDMNLAAKDFSSRIHYWGAWQNKPILAPIQAHVPFLHYEPSAADLSAALLRIKPSIEKFVPNVNLFEIIGELKDVRKLLNIFSFKQKTFADEIASKHLEYNFGVVPFASTIVDIFKILTTLDNVIDRWNSFALSKGTMDFHETIALGDDMHNWSVKDESIRNSSYQDYDLYEYKVNVNYVSKVHIYITPHFIPEGMRFQALAKAMGLDKPLYGLWNLVPFSWMVDYFINVGDMIDYWEKGLEAVFKFDVTEAGYSVKSSYEAQGRYTRYLYTTSIASGWSSVTESRFKRTVLPTTLFTDLVIPKTLGWAGGPSTKQATYMLAVAQTLRK
jgi:hypothetical protein